MTTLSNPPFEFNYSKISIIEDGHYDLTAPFWQDIETDLENVHNANVVLGAMNHAVNILTAIVGAADEAFLRTKYGAAFQFVMKVPGAVAEITLETSWDETNQTWTALIVETGEEFIETSFNVAVGIGLAVAGAALIPVAAGVVTTLSVATVGFGVGEILSKVYDNYLEDNIKEGLESIFDDINVNNQTDTRASLGKSDGTTEEYKVNTSQTINAIVDALGFDFPYLESTNAGLSDNLATLSDGSKAVIYQDNDSIDITPSGGTAFYSLEMVESSLQNGEVLNAGQAFITITNATEIPTDLDLMFVDPNTGKFISGFKYTDTNGDEINFTRTDNIDYNELKTELGGAHHSAPEPVLSGSGSFFFSAEGTLFDTDGETYLLKNITDGIQKTGEAVVKFISNQAEGVFDYITDGTGLQTSFIQFVDAFSDDFANGTMDADDAIAEYAKLLANNYLQETVTGALTTEESFGYIRDSLVSGLELDTPAANKLAGSIIGSISQMVGTFATQSSGWDSEDYAKASGAIIANAVYNYAVTEYFGEYVAAQFLGQAGVSVITSLINSGEITSEQWEDIALTIAFGSAVQTFSGNTLENTVNVVKEAIAISVAYSFGGSPAVYATTKLILNVIQGSLYKGKKFYEGEFGDKAGLIESVYQVQDIEVDDGTGTGTLITVPALVAVSAEGSTVIMQQGITHLIGGIGADILVGAETDDVISGGGGSDYLEGKDGDETLFGGDGNDHIIGGAGDDIIQGDAGEDIIFGDGGEDTILGGDGQDFIHGGGGSDAILGGLERDIILGAGGDDVIQGDAGDDMIDGGYGDDLLDGGDGDDLMLGNLGNDSITGGDGDDIAFGDEGNDQIVGGNGDDYLNGGAGVDILEGGNGDDLIYGDSGDDMLTGDLGNDNLGGGLGDDTILGGLDDDYLYGEIGDDDLDGGLGDDFINGGLGTDVLKGDAGDDVYILEANDSGAYGNDTITDSEGVNDRIYINGLDGSNLANLTFAQDGDNLVLSYNAMMIATIAGHYVSGADSIERIEFDTDQFIDLSTLTFDGNGVGSYTLGTDASQTTKADIDVRESDINANIQEQSAYWNNGFIQNLSDMAYEEALRDQFEMEQYNGGEITEFKRARGKFGGHYKVYKVEQSTELNGTPQIIGIKVLETGENPDDYSSLYSGEKIVTTGINSTLSTEFGTWTFTGGVLVDLWTNNELFITEFFYNEDHLNGVGEYAASPEGLQVELDGSFNEGYFYLDSNDAVARKTNGTIENVDFGETVLNTGSDHLVGSWWNEVILGNSGDDALFGGGGNDTINGEAGDDWLFGGDGNDIVDGGTGNDSVFGGAGNDIINGGDGDDAIIGGSGDDIIYGEDGSDWIDAGDGVDFIYGGAGNDVIYAGGGDDYAEGGTGIDVIYGQGGNDILYGNEGADYLYGGEGNDTVYGVEDEDLVSGGTGNDILYGNGGVDEIYGGEGNDLIYGGAGGDILDGGAGEDTLSYFDSDAGVLVDLTNWTASGGYADGDTISNFTRVYGSEFTDTLTGNDNYNRLYAFGGDDTLNGLDGNDYLYGHYLGADTLNGGDGDDAIYAGLQGDIIDGGVGNKDYLSYYYASSSIGVNIDIAAGTADGINGGIQDTFSNIERFYGSNGNDIITSDNIGHRMYGYDGDDIIIGGDGTDLIRGHNDNDTLIGNAGDDDIYGGAGIDTLNGGNGVDELYGEAGSDTLNGGNGIDYLYGGDGVDYLNGEAGDDVIYGDLGNDVIDGGSDTDTISYYNSLDNLIIDLSNNMASGSSIGLDFITNIEQVLGGEGDDIITGSNTADVLDGYIGNDTLYGLDGDDTLYGGAGANTYYGGEGIDTLYGGSWHDYFHGGADGDFMYGGDKTDFFYGGAGADYMDGQGGSDRLYYGTSASAVNLNLKTNVNTGGDAQDDTIISMTRIYMSDYDDSITATDDSEYIYGYDGVDTIYGEDGADTIYGGNENDIIHGGAGDDILNGDAGNDAIYADSGDDTLNGGAGNDTLRGNYAGADILNGDAGDDTLYGGLDGDILNGGDDYDSLTYFYTTTGVTIDMDAQTVDGVAAGGVQDTFTGIERIYASRGDDFVYGDSADTEFHGYDGDDQIDGKAGQDNIWGDGGNDIFIFSDLTHSTDSAQDVIKDFTQGADKIDLTAFSFVSISDFTISDVSGDTVVDDNSSDFSFKLTGLYTLADNDFDFV